MQDLHYAYDPAGNITQIADDALPTIFHNNQQVEPIYRYTYDALYRLIEATGREHIAQSAFLFDPPGGNFRDYPFAGATQLNDLQAVRNYTETIRVRRRWQLRADDPPGCHGNWTREYTYNEPSLTEPDRKSNRLSSRRCTPMATSRSSSRTARRARQHDLHAAPAVDAVGLPGPASGHGETGLQQRHAGDHLVRLRRHRPALRKVREPADRPESRTSASTWAAFEIYRKHGNERRLVRETLHIMDDKQRIALVETRTDMAMIDPGATHPLPVRQSPRLGRLELDDEAQIISYEEYYPYGSTSYQAVRSQTETPKRYRYTGKERDEESGLYYHGARYYAPWLGRWISCESLSGLMTA